MARPYDGNMVSETRPATAGDRSLGELFTDLSHDLTELVRGELELAKAEMTQKAMRVGKDFGFLAAGIAIAYAGFLAVIAGLVIIVAHVMPWWLAALLVGLVVAGIGGFLIFQGLQDLKSANLAPTQSIDALKEDAQWTKEAI